MSCREYTDYTSVYFTTRSTVIRNLKVVNRLDRVDTPNTGVSKAEQEFLVIFISVSEILANQQEVRFDSARGAGRVSRQILNVKSNAYVMLEVPDL